MGQVCNPVTQMSHTETCPHGTVKIFFSLSVHTRHFFASSNSFTLSNNLLSVSNNDEDDDDEEEEFDELGEEEGELDEVDELALFPEVPESEEGGAVGSFGSSNPWTEVLALSCKVVEVVARLKTPLLGSLILFHQSGKATAIVSNASWVRQ